MTDAPETPARHSHWAVIGLFLISAGGVLVLARSFLMPLILAFLLSLTFSPVRRFLKRRGLPDGVSASIIVLALVSVCGVAIIGLTGPVQDYIEDGPNIMRDVEYKLRGLNDLVAKVSDATEKVDELTDTESKTTKLSVDTGPGMFTQVVLSLPYVAAQGALTLVMLFFLIASGDMFYEKIVAVSPTFKDKRRAIEIVYDIERKISRYFLTITGINAGLGGAVGLALWALGMPNPVLFGVLAFGFNFIPFIGALVGVALAFAIGIVSFNTVGQAGLVAAVYFLLTSIEGQLVTPFAVGRSLNLNPVAVFVAVAFWGWAWSVVGMFVAVPVLIIIRALAEQVEKLYPLGVFLSGRGDDELGHTPPE